MSTKHTPGPWTVQLLEQGRDGYEGWNSYCIRDEKTNVHIASVGHVDRYFEKQNEGNARLIAAAPDYHAAAAKFCGMYEKGIVGTDLDACYREFKVAIAKATGAQS